MLDEFPSLGPCDAFETSLPYLGGFGVFAMLIVQGVNQLHQSYGPLTSMLSNCKAKVFHRPGDGLSAQTVETLLGTTTVVRQAPSEHWQDFGFNRSFGSSEVQTPRALLTAGELLALPDRHEIVFVSGLPGPVFADKTPWFRDIVQPAHLMLGRVAMVAACAMVFVGALALTSWALWPTNSITAPKAPSLSRSSLLSPESQAQADAMIEKYRAQAEAMREKPQARPWVLAHTLNGQPQMVSFLAPCFATQEACEAEIVKYKAIEQGQSTGGQPRPRLAGPVRGYACVEQPS